MTVWEAADDHPLRALQIVDGKLGHVRRPARGLDRAAELPEGVLLRSGRVGVPQADACSAATGPNPWWWMGKNVKPIIRPWITGRDINGPYDVPFHEWFVRFPDVVERISKLEP